MPGDTAPKKPFSPWHPDLSEWFENFPFGRSGEQNSIRIEEFERDGALVVLAELPGIDPEKDVEITVRDRSLTIQAERTEEQRDKRRSEFRYGSFTRTIPLPAQAKEEEVTAGYAKGLLTVTVPLDTERPAARQVRIKHEE
ncbi:HSP20 family protein [Kitasatospora sp. GAS204A]|uniref:Hsp20/alpha crystallin family protein n=1 Tax=unclassified Kitasatospora TaxID=2633591 RepID=UPI002473C567|nr:Hsp20/alpha crystallin family protein [Kitasatospora sp. GAS204B]MDH6121050.1 HSP20 family protein [Kitasatospora sp. GAS204B]